MIAELTVSEHEGGSEVWQQLRMEEMILTAEIKCAHKSFKIKLYENEALWWNTKSPALLNYWQYYPLFRTYKEHMHKFKSACIGKFVLYIVLL